MGYIKEPECIILYVENRQPTPQEDREVSEYIAHYRAAHPTSNVHSSINAKEPLPKKSTKSTKRQSSPSIKRTVKAL